MWVWAWSLCWWWGSRRSLRRPQAPVRGQQPPRSPRSAGALRASTCHRPLASGRNRIDEGSEVPRLRLVMPRCLPHVPPRSISPDPAKEMVIATGAGPAAGSDRTIPAVVSPRGSFGPVACLAPVGKRWTRAVATETAQRRVAPTRQSDEVPVAMGNTGLTLVRIRPASRFGRCRTLQSPAQDHLSTSLSGSPGASACWESGSSSFPLSSRPAGT